MMIILGWLAALVALLTALAMVKDIRLYTDLSGIRGQAIRAWRDLVHTGWRSIDRDDLRLVVRFCLRTTTLVLVAASSGVCVFLPVLTGPVSVYDLALRSALAAFLALQAPCPWLRYVAIGDRRCGTRTAQESRPHVR
jgi:hypothetical protein